MKKIAAVMILLFSLTSFSQTTTTFIVLRHAEKADTTKDTNLSTEGLIRADALRETLQSVYVNAIYSTPYNRTKQTVTPLASEKKIAITEYPANKPYAELVNELIAAHHGQTVVIVGHSNTVPEILKVLTKNAYNVTINENQFDNIFVVILKEGKPAEVTTMKYGKSTP
ncbi:phosphoglycerate mutase family protein [Flavobacterium terrisoli]|uniref:phosphoglycerate mutase family protein n=1 Tax=Flavobacterium terrisoli TaxID=3242195 RepID=UPI002542A8BA|nr:phosphoglycerate mutase family protein [Flavobacterium buctense]